MPPGIGFRGIRPQVCVGLLHQKGKKKGNGTAWKILGERRDEHEPIKLARAVFG